MKNTMIHNPKKSTGRKISALLLILCWLIAFNSCTDKFEEFNTDKTGLTISQLEVDGNVVGVYFPKIYKDITMDGAYQLNNNLIGDCFAGYLTPTQGFGRGTQTNMNYVMVNGWNTAVWNTAYDGMSNVSQVTELAAKYKLPHFAAIAKILQVEIMHRTTDTWGPIIYTQFGKSTTSAVYDDQKTVYYAFFDELKAASATLQAFIDDGNKGLPFLKFDFVYDGDLKKWIKFSNSLRLRLAMRLAKADLPKAKLEAEAAISARYGVMSSNSENFKISKQPNWLNVINNDWNDIRMGAMMESYLTGYNDPRIDKMFLKSTDPKPGMTDKYKGIRNGINISAKTDYIGFSKLAWVKSSEPMLFMMAAEMDFLKAEGVLRGWDMGGGTVQENYERGISTSMGQWDASSASYITDNTRIPLPYQDPYNAANDFPTNPTSITIKWNEAATFDEKLERIITQKWIATFPEGHNAWAEFRRTGYPKMMPVVVNGDPANVPTDKFIRRITYPQSEKDANTAEYNKAVTLLGGLDNPGTRVWWDKP
jgi:hypothetical protein